MQHAVLLPIYKYVVYLALLYFTQLVSRLCVWLFFSYKHSFTARVSSVQIIWFVWYHVIGSVFDFYSLQVRAETSLISVIYSFLSATESKEILNLNLNVFIYFSYKNKQVSDWIWIWILLVKPIWHIRMYFSEVNKLLLPTSPETALGKIDSSSIVQWLRYFEKCPNSYPRNVSSPEVFCRSMPSLT